MHHRLSIVPYVLLSEYASEIGHGGWGLMRILATVRPIEDAKMAARPVMQQWPIVVDRISSYVSHKKRHFIPR